MYISKCGEKWHVQATDQFKNEMFFEHIVTQEEFIRDHRSSSEELSQNKYIFMVKGSYILQENSTEHIEEILKKYQDPRKNSESANLVQVESELSKEEV